jgi:hypothetical protein
MLSAFSVLELFFVVVGTIFLSCAEMQSAHYATEGVSHVKRTGIALYFSSIMVCLSSADNRITEVMWCGVSFFNCELFYSIASVS